jgi:hypothetical protein
MAFVQNMTTDGHESSSSAHSLHREDFLYCSNILLALIKHGLNLPFPLAPRYLVVPETTHFQFLVGTTPGMTRLLSLPFPLCTVQARLPIEFAGHSMHLTNSTGAHPPIQTVGEMNVKIIYIWNTAVEIIPLRRNKRSD